MIVILLKSILLMTIFYGRYGFCLMSSAFHTKDRLCNVEERVRLGCAQEKPGMRSLVDCVAQCRADELCVGASVDTESGICFHHNKLCALPVECEQDDDGGDDDNHIHDNYWGRHCVHGYRDDLTSSCQCLFKTFGVRCDQYLAQCEHYDPYQRALINSDGDSLSDPILVVCFGPYMIALRNDGSGEFNATYNDYVRGIWTNNNNFWIGLRTMRTLNQAGYTNLLLVADFKHITNVYRIYFNFHLQDEMGGFSFTFANSHFGSTGNLPPGSFMGDCLGSLQNKAFSAWNYDQDESADENCAGMVGAGWWYSTCHSSTGTACNHLGVGEPERELDSHAPCTTDFRGGRG